MDAARGRLLRTVVRAGVAAGTLASVLVGPSCGHQPAPPETSVAERITVVVVHCGPGGNSASAVHPTADNATRTS